MERMLATGLSGEKVKASAMPARSRSRRPRASTRRCADDRVDVGGRVSLEKPLVLLAPGAVHGAPPLYRGSRGDLLRPADDVPVRGDVEELRRFVENPLHQGPLPGPGGAVGDPVLCGGQGTSS